MNAVADVPLVARRGHLRRLVNGGAGDGPLKAQNPHRHKGVALLAEGRPSQSHGDVSQSGPIGLVVVCQIDDGQVFGENAPPGIDTVVENGRSLGIEFLVLVDVHVDGQAPLLVVAEDERRADLKFEVLVDPHVQWQILNLGYNIVHSQM